MAAYSGFSEADYDTVFIILDKMDKIGMDGVREELNQEGYDKSAVDTYLDLFHKVTNDIEGVKYLREASSVGKTKTADFKMSFDPTLVRGMSYYTGPIFEISMDEFGGSVGGGGRYDEMIGRFTGNATPACGFSIGFERIIMLLLEREFQVPHKAGRTAYLIEKNMPQDKLADILEKAKAARAAGEEKN